MIGLLTRTADRIRGRHRPDADPLVADLVDALGADRVQADAAARYLASRDASIFSEGAAGPVCFPASTEQVQACMRIAARHNRAVVPRGAGTGLSGGAAPMGSPVVLSLTAMNSVLEVDLDNRIAWVQPGLVNLELSRRVAAHGLHFAPDPSSQQACTIGGNVANNSGGPHCLAYGVTSAHVAAVEVVLSDGEAVVLGGLEAEPDGYDLRGAFVGSEGLCGVATAVAVRLTPNPPAVKTMLAAYPDVASAAATVGAVIADGMVPAAMELMDARAVAVIEDFVRAGYPRDAAAVLLIEVDGMDAGTEIQAERVAAVAAANGAASVRVAADEAERALLWKGRKNAFGAVANLEPDYYLHDTVVPRGKLVEVIEAVGEIADRHGISVINVFHAGDGNLHPILAYDARVEGTAERVAAAGEEIIGVSLAAGGALSGEHGIGVEKRDHMDKMFAPADLDHQNRLRQAFDPHCRMNPGKVLPTPHSCADIASLKAADGALWG